MFRDIHSCSLSLELCRASSRSVGSRAQVLDSYYGAELNPNAYFAQVGFSAGDGVRYYYLSGSGTDEVLELNSTSNVERAGVWIFRVDGSTVEPGGAFDSSVINPLSKDL